MGWKRSIERGLKRQRGEVNMRTEKAEENNLMRAKCVCLEKRGKYISVVSTNNTLKRINLYSPKLGTSLNSQAIRLST